MLWLGTACSIWIPFIIVTDVIRLVNNFQWLRRWRFALSSALAVCIPGGFLWFTTVDTPFPAPYMFAVVGGGYPTTADISLVIKEANLGGPFVLWKYTQSQGGMAADQYDDQLANFWAAVTWDIKPNGDPLPWGGSVPNFFEWAYVETTHLTSLCQILHHQTIRIVTSDPTLRAKLAKSCRAYLHHVKADVISVLPAVKP